MPDGAHPRNVLRQSSERDELAITADDAQLIREILRRWNNMSNLDAGDHGYHSMTDHCHNTYDAGECLADKLEKIAKASSPNNQASHATHE